MRNKSWQRFREYVFGNIQKSAEVAPADPLSDDTQAIIATELALKAAVDMVVFLKTAWNELVLVVESAGIDVGVTPEAQSEYMEIANRIHASFIVVGETQGFPDGAMKYMKGPPS